MGKKKKTKQKAEPKESVPQTGDSAQGESAESSMTSTSTQVASTPRPEPTTAPISGSEADGSAGPSTEREPGGTGGTDEKKPKEDLAKEFREKLVMAPKPSHRPFPKRPGFVTEGTPVFLLTNHFLLKVGKKQAFHYDIEIERAFRPEDKNPNLVDKDVEESTLKEEKRNKYTRKMATKLNRNIFQQMVDNYSQNPNQVFYGINPVYDGQKNMFTSKVLEGTGGENQILRLRVDITEMQRTSGFFVNIKLAETNHTIDLNVLNLYHSGRTCDEEVIKKSVLFINTLLRHNASMSLIPIGQSIYDPKTEGQAISNYVLLSYGFYSSVRNLMVGPTLNVNRSAACFYSPIKIETLIGFIIRGDLSSIPALSDYQKRQIRKELSGLQVEATHISYGNSFRKYRILGLSKLSAKELKFSWNEKDGNRQEISHGMVSIEDYFRLKYRKTLKYPNLPCLEVGNPNNRVNLPLEFCKIVSHQRLRRSLTNDEKSKMTQASGSQKPRERLGICKRYVEDQFHSGPVAEKNKPYLYEFGIDVFKDLIKIESQVIKAPELKYKNNQSVTPMDGEWEMYKTKSTFLKAARLKEWIVINISFSRIDDTNINAFVNDLCSQAREMGMVVEKLPMIVKIPDKGFDPKKAFNGIKTKLKDTKFKDLEMILFLTPLKSSQFSDEIYSEIKLLGDVEKGVTTQCVNIDNIWNDRSTPRPRKWNRSYLRQLMLKVNPKLGGTNVAMALESSSMPSIFQKKSLMIVGADVNHPAPADRITPSIAAMVGSYDDEYSNYYTTVSMQPKSREEMIKKLDQMILELLKNYFLKQKSLPQRIIFYRDGVSEGQFQHVIDNEYPLLLKAFAGVPAKIATNYKPKLTFIVVQKRHHTRFMTTDGYNVSPGTVVEQSITSKNDFDFYLASHAGRLGTSRSAHYYVLADENSFTANDMCKMTYYLCHIYQRCTKSVSIPAPVYYADLAAYRAKVHASSLQNIGFDARSVSSGSDLGGDHEESQIKTFEDYIKVTDSQKQRLYFC